MTNKRIWYPIKDIGMIGKYIADQLRDTQEQYEVFKKAKERPGSMNNQIVDRMKKVLTEQKGYIKLYEEQVLKWEKEAKSVFIKQDVARLIVMLAELSKINNDSLIIADDISKDTIENIMKMNEIELAIKTLTGELSLPKDKKDKN
jgi:hypothetical protein